MPISINMKELMEVKSFIFCILYVPSREIFRKLHFMVAEDRNTKCSIKWEEDKERERTSLVTRDLRRIKTKYFDSLSSISIMCPHTWDSGPVMCHYKLYPAEHSRHSAQLIPSFVRVLNSLCKNGESLCVWLSDGHYELSCLPVQLLSWAAPHWTPHNFLLCSAQPGMYHGLTYHPIS